MGPMMQPFAESFRFTDFIMNLVIGDLKDEDARRRARGTEGASISWIVGHLTSYRRKSMALLGVETADPLAKQFGDGEATDGKGYPTIGELRAQWSATHAEFDKVLEKTADSRLQARLPANAGPHAEKTVMAALAFMMWHESYHMGQLGTIRRQLGYTGTADLAVAAATAAAAAAKA